MLKGRASAGNGAGNLDAVLAHNDRVTDIDGVPVPLGVLGAEPDAAMTDILIAHGVDGPRSGVHEETALSEANRVFDVQQIAVGGCLLYTSPSPRD